MLIAHRIKVNYLFKFCDLSPLEIQFLSSVIYSKELNDKQISKINDIYEDRKIKKINWNNDLNTVKYRAYH